MSSARPLTLLLTSAGSHSAESVLDCLAACRDRLRLVATNSLADAPPLFRSDAAYLVPPAADRAAVLPRLRDILRRERPDAVLAGRDADLPLLADLSVEPEFAATRWLCPGASTLPIFEDKSATAAFAAAHGLPFAEVATTPEGAVALGERHGWPLFAKPRRGGHASKGVVLVATPEQASAAVERGDMLVQRFAGRSAVRTALDPWTRDVPRPWVLEAEFSGLQFEFALDSGHRLCAGPVVAEVAAQGSFTRALRLRDDAPLTSLAMRHAEALAAAGHVGPCNVQGMPDPEFGLVAFEWNARFTGCASGHALLGRNLVHALLSAEWPDRLPAPDPAATSATVFRTRVFQPLPAAESETLRAHGYWRRDAGAD